MTQATKDQLFEAWLYCDEEDKSTEFMFQYMADTAGVSYETAVDFVTRTTKEERETWFTNQLKSSIEGQIESDIHDFFDSMGKETLDNLDARGAVKAFGRWMVVDHMKQAAQAIEEMKQEN